MALPRTLSHEPSTIRGQPCEELRPRLRFLKPTPQLLRSISPVPYLVFPPLMVVFTLWPGRALVGGTPYELKPLESTAPTPHVA
jgi:hypothetical protein